VVYIGTVDACWINRMLAGCQVPIRRGCAIYWEAWISSEYSDIGEKEWSRYLVQ